VPRGTFTIEGSSAGANAGTEGASALGGVVDRGTLEEDGPVTWETLISPVGILARRGASARIPDAPCAGAGARMAGTVVERRHGTE